MLYQRKIFNETAPFVENSYSMRIEGGNTQVRSMMMQVDNLENGLSIQADISCDKARSKVYFIRSQGASVGGEWTTGNTILIQCGDSRKVVTG